MSISGGKSSLSFLDARYIAIGHLDAAEVVTIEGVEG